MSTNEDKTQVKYQNDKFIITKKTSSVDNKFVQDLIQKTILKQNDIGDNINDFIKNIIVKADENSGDVKLFPPDQLFEVTWNEIPKTQVFYFLDSPNLLQSKETLRTLVNNRMFRFPMVPEQLMINQLNVPKRADRWYSQSGTIQLQTPSSQSKMFRKGAPDSKNFSMPDNASYVVYGQQSETSHVICVFPNDKNDFDSLKQGLSVAFAAFDKQKNSIKNNQIVILKSLRQWQDFETIPLEFQAEYEFHVQQLSSLYASNNHIFVDSVDKLFNTASDNDTQQWIIFPWNNKSWIYHETEQILLFNVIFNGGKEDWISVDIVDSIYNKVKEDHFSHSFLDHQKFIIEGGVKTFFKAGLKLADNNRRVWNWKELPIGYQNLSSYEKYLPIYQQITKVEREWNIGDFWYDQLDSISIPHINILGENSSGFGNFLIVTNETNDIFYPRRFWNQFAHVLTVDTNRETEIFVLPKESDNGAFPLSATIEHQFYNFIQTEFDRNGEKWSKIREEYMKLFQIMWLSTFILTIQLMNINAQTNKELLKTWDKSSGQPKPNVLGAEVSYLFNFLRSTSFKFWMLINNLLNDNLYMEFAQWDDIPLSFAASGGIVDTLNEDFYLSSKIMIFTSRLLNVLLTNVYVAPLKRKYFKSDKKIPESEMALYASKSVDTESYLCTYMGVRVASEFSVTQEVNTNESTAIICPTIVKTELLSQSSYTVGLQSFATKILDNGCLQISTERIIPDDVLLVNKLELAQRTIALLFVEKKSLPTLEQKLKSDVEKFLLDFSTTAQLDEDLIKTTIFKYFPYLSTTQMKTVYPILHFDQHNVKQLNDILPIRLPSQSELKNSKDFKMWFSPFLANMTFDIWNPYLLGGDHMASVGKFANGAVTEQIKNDLVRQIPQSQAKINDWITVNPNAEFVIYEMDPIVSTDKNNPPRFKNDYYLSSIHSTAVFLDKNIKPRLRQESLLQPIMQGMEIITPTDFMSKMQIQFIKSTKPLKPDEEVIIDYGSEYWINIDTPFGKRNMLDTFDTSRSIFSIFNYYFLLSNVSRSVIKSDKHTTDYLFLDKDLKLRKPETLTEINYRVATLSVIWDAYVLNGFKPEDIDDWFTQLERRLNLTVHSGRKTVTNLAMRLVEIEKATGLKNSEEIDKEFFDNREQKKTTAVYTKRQLINRINALVKKLNLNFVELKPDSTNEQINKNLNEVESHLKISAENQNVSGDRTIFTNLVDRLLYDELKAYKFFPPENINDWIKRAHFISVMFKLPIPTNIKSEADIDLMNNWLSLVETKMKTQPGNGKTFSDMARRLSNIELQNEDSLKLSPKLVQSVILVLGSPELKIQQNSHEIKELKLDKSDRLSKIKIEYLQHENQILFQFEKLKDEFSDEELNHKLGESQTVDQILFDVMKQQISLLNHMNILIDDIVKKTMDVTTRKASDFKSQLLDEQKANLILMTEINSTLLTQKVLSLYKAENLSVPSQTELKDKIIDILSHL